MDRRNRSRPAPGDPEDEAEDLYGLAEQEDDEPDVVRCPRCGRDVWPDAETCPRCGSSLDSRPAGQAWLGRSWWWIALALAGILAVILDYLFLLI